MCVAWNFKDRLSISVLEAGRGGGGGGGGTVRDMGIHIQLVLPQSLVFGSWIIERGIFMCFSFVSICKYLLTAGLREQNINVT